MMKGKSCLYLVLLFVFAFILSSCNGLASFKFDDDYLELEVGETKKSTSISNQNKEINFFSVDESVAQVDMDGNITGVSKGETTIYALFKNEAYQCHIRVTSATSTIEVYERDALLTCKSDDLGIKVAIPIKATYNGHDNLVELEDNTKVQFTCDFMKASSDPSEILAESNAVQIQQNISFMSLLTSLGSLFTTNNLMKPFNDVFMEYNDALGGLSGQELENKIKELKPLIGYFFLQNNYLAVALFKGDELACYSYSNEEYGIVAKIKSFVLLATQLINSGINFQKIDYIGLLQSYEGDLITPETQNKLKSYQNIVSTLAYIVLGELKINKSIIDNDKNQARLTIDITEDGMKKIQENDTKLVIMKSINASLDLFKDTTTNYTHLRCINLNLGTALGPIHLNLKGKDIKKALGDNLFPYEAKHKEYEAKSASSN